MKKPEFLTPLKDGIPEDLKTFTQFVCWKGEWDGSRWTKVPYNPKSDKGQRAKTDDPNTWSDFPTTWNIYEKKSFDGIGVVLTESDPIIGIDIDYCINDGEIDQETLNLIKNINSYTEYSPSGNGIRIFIKGTLPKGWRKKGNFEMYSEGRYLTLTGHKLPDYSENIREMSPQDLQEIRLEIEDIIELQKAFEQGEKGEKIKKLFRGNWEGLYPSQSEADSALCFYLAYIFGEDPQVIDRVFRRSGLFREKWDEKHFSDGDTYGARLILEATHQKSKLQRPRGINAAELLRMDIPPIKWLVKDLIAPGVSILGGKPKYGKSLLVLNIGLAIAFGKKALGSISVDQGSVIYLALEDTQRRLQNRIEKMLDGRKAPEKLVLFTNNPSPIPRMGQGGIRFLEETIQTYNDLRLVIIDTYARFKPSSSKKTTNLYDDDYQTISRIKDLADRYDVSILIVHHLRKAEADDVMDCFSGTLGLTGAADGLLALIRKSTSVELHVRGRDIEEREFTLKFNPQVMSWCLLGDPKGVQQTTKQQKIYDCLVKANKDLTSKEISQRTGLDYQYVRNVLSRKCDEWGLLQEERGQYKLPF